MTSCVCINVYLHGLHWLHLYALHVLYFVYYLLRCVHYVGYENMVSVCSFLYCMCMPPFVRSSLYEENAW